MLRVLATLLISLTLAAAASAQLMDKKALTLDGAKKLAAAAEAEATKNNWRVVIVIVDDGGLPLVVDGKLVGGIGVSGVTSQQDGQIAKAGADALPKLLGR